MCSEILFYVPLDTRMGIKYNHQSFNHRGYRLLFNGIKLNRPSRLSSFRAYLFDAVALFAFFSWSLVSVLLIDQEKLSCYAHFIDRDYFVSRGLQGLNFYDYKGKSRNRDNYRLPFASLPSSPPSSSSSTRRLKKAEEKAGSKKKVYIRPVAISTWKFGHIAVREAAQILSNEGNALDAVEMGVTAVEMVCRTSKK